MVGFKDEEEIEFRTLPSLTLKRMEETMKELEKNSQDFFIITSLGDFLNKKIIKNLYEPISQKALNSPMDI